jgi:mRNA interferase MazF
VIERGRICWLEGERPAARRPVLVLQADPFNRSAIPTVLVAPLAQDLRLAEAPGNVALTAKASGLPRDTVLVVSQISTVERARLRETAGRLDQPLLAEVGEGLRLVLGLSP